MEKRAIQYGKKHELNLKVIIGLYRLQLQVNRSTQRMLSSHGLTVAQFGVLEAVYHLGPMSIGEILAKTLSTSGNMTVVLRNLEKEGWIQRNSDPRDGRVSRIELTAKGRKLVQGIFPEHLRDLDRALGNLEEAEKAELVRLFKKWSGI